MDGDRIKCPVSADLNESAQQNPFQATKAHFKWQAYSIKLVAQIIIASEASNFKNLEVAKLTPTQSSSIHDMLIKAHFLNFLFQHFPPIFRPIKIDLSGNTVSPQVTFLKPRQIYSFGIFSELSRYVFLNQTRSLYLLDLQATYKFCH